uniref:Uncharacterized protein n=1 Tax=Ascaris lumbricoides TaxID=6252 RepID=A0A0M3IMR1_ASCLU
MAATLRSSYAVGKGNLLETSFRDGQRHLPTIVDLLVNESIRFALSINVVLHVLLHVLFKALHRKLFVIEEDFHSTCRSGYVKRPSAHQRHNIIIKFCHPELGQVRSERHLCKIFTLTLSYFRLTLLGHVVDPGLRTLSKIAGYILTH